MDNNYKLVPMIVCQYPEETMHEYTIRFQSHTNNPEDNNYILANYIQSLYNSLDDYDALKSLEYLNMFINELKAKFAKDHFISALNIENYFIRLIKSPQVSYDPYSSKYTIQFISCYNKEKCITVSARIWR